MNTSINSTKPLEATSGMPGAVIFRGYDNAFDDLEPLIDRLRKFTQLQGWLIETTFAESGDVTVLESRASHLCFLAWETQAAADELDKAWLASHNAGCDAERARRGL